jgi:hypothetical protein
VEPDELQDQPIAPALESHSPRIRGLLAGDAVVHVNVRLANVVIPPVTESPPNEDCGFVTLGAQNGRLLKHNPGLGRDPLDGAVVNDGCALDDP